MIAIKTPPQRGTANRRGCPPRPGDPQLEQFQAKFQARLEASYEFHTERLARLSAAAGKNKEQAFNRDLRALASRHALTAIAAALRGMAEGRYGICEGCDDLIPSERLEKRPEARYCLTCQATHAPLTPAR